MLNVSVLHTNISQTAYPCWTGGSNKAFNFCNCLWIVLNDVVEGDTRHTYCLASLDLSHASVHVLDDLYSNIDTGGFGLILSTNASLGSGHWLHRQSLVKGCSRPPVKLTALLIRGATANGFGHPVGGPLCVHVDRANDSEMLAVGQSSNDAASVPMGVAG